MINFEDFLSRKYQENISKEEQLGKLQKTFDRLGIMKKRLAGINTQPIDDQMNHISGVLNRRQSGNHQWHGSIVRIEQEPIGGMPMWKLMSREGMAFHIPVKDAAGVTKIPVNWHSFPSEKNPMSKFIEYREESIGSSKINLITHTENRTVDIVPFRSKEGRNQYYLIQRRRSGLWATPGGHIDAGELNTPILAARRELVEETQAQPLVIKPLPTGWIKETATNPSLNPAVEYNSWTLPFIAIIDPNFVMKPSDDASGGDWFEMGQIPPSLHFAHHKQIIHKAFEYLPNLLKQFGKHT